MKFGTLKKLWQTSGELSLQTKSIGFRKLLFISPDIRFEQLLGTVRCILLSTISLNIFETGF